MGAYSPSIPQGLNLFHASHPSTSDQASHPVKSSSVAREWRVPESIDASLPQCPKMIPATGYWERAIPSTCWIVCHESRNDNNDVLGRFCCELSRSGSPSGLPPYNRTRRFPPEARADPLTCLLHIYRLLQASPRIQSTLLECRLMGNTNMDHAKFYVDVSWKP